MSVQANTYVMRGALVPYSEMKGRYDELAPYMDSAFKGIHHKDGVCVLYDGMNGKYVAVGRVLAKTKNHQGLDEPVFVSDAGVDDEDELQNAVSAMWSTPTTLPEKGEGERFSVYLAFDDRTVRLADWVAYTTMGAEYHANGTYLGQYPQDGDALYMTDDGYDVRKTDDGAWETFSHCDDGTKKRHVVVGWMEAMKPVPEWSGEPVK